MQQIHFSIYVALVNGAVLYRCFILTSVEPKEILAPRKNYMLIRRNRQATGMSGTFINPYSRAGPRCLIHETCDDEGT